MKERFKMIFDRIDNPSRVHCLRVQPHSSGGLYGILEGGCAMLYNDLHYHRSLLHPPLQREAEEGAD